MTAEDETFGSVILLVEDEETLAIGLEYNLKEEGYQVVRAKDGREALKKYGSGGFDLVILDIMLPYVDGFEVARKIRVSSPQMPILMLTAKAQPDDRVHGLELGVDDYMTKPFHLMELLLRVKGMLKRKAWYRKTLESGGIFHFGDNEVDFNSLSCRSGKQRFQLTPLEATLLNYLISHADTIVSRKELLENVWNITSDVETRTVENFIVRLRRYFEPDPGNPTYIKNIRGAGYLFTEGKPSP